MADPDAAWAMYVARYDTTRYYSRIIPDSIRVLQTSRTEISTEQLDAERERTGLGFDLQVTRIDAPAHLIDSDLADLAARQIAAEPAFDFFDDVVGEDIVFMGVVYSSDEWTHDPEDGVRRLTEEEIAERHAELDRATGDLDPDFGDGVGIDG